MMLDFCTCSNGISILVSCGEGYNAKLKDS